MSGEAPPMPAHRRGQGHAVAGRCFLPDGVRIPRAVGTAPPPGSAKTPYAPELARYGRPTALHADRRHRPRRGHCLPTPHLRTCWSR
ncbi:hypothetical protein [Streptomyces sp. NPDC098781]|uniref:hypothetical protein n=1 Tax=Streptomyces sp. NPDC098781 TaxID=3366097 RepID=UPI0037F4DB3A